MLSPWLLPPIHTLPSRSTMMLCSAAAPGRAMSFAGQPSVYPGPPHACSRLPAVSNSSTAGAAMQQSVRGGFVAAPASSGLISRGRFINPDVIVLVGVHRRHALHQPLVLQGRLRPERVHLIYRDGNVLRLRRGRKRDGQKTKCDRGTAAQPRTVRPIYLHRKAP